MLPVVAAIIGSIVSAAASKAMEQPKPGQMGGTGGGGGGAPFEPTAGKFLPPDRKQQLQQALAPQGQGATTPVPTLQPTGAGSVPPDPTAPTTATLGLNNSVAPGAFGMRPEGEALNTSMLTQALAGSSAGKPTGAKPAASPTKTGEAGSDTKTGEAGSDTVDWAQIAQAIGSRISDQATPQRGPMGGIIGRGSTDYNPTVPSIQDMLRAALQGRARA